MEEKYKIHAVYILAILIAIIVILVTIKWSQIPNLAELITFALTVSSLILAVLAIGYAVYSNTSFSQTIWRLNDATRDISGAAKEITEATNDLTSKITAIPTRLESMELKVEQTNVLLQQYYEKQDMEPFNPQEKKAAGQIADPFIKRVPPRGLLILYAYSLAFKKQSPFNAEQLFSTIEGMGRDYSLGFINATKATGLISSIKNPDNKDIVTVTYMDERVWQDVEDELNSRISSKPKGTSDEEFNRFQNSMRKSMHVIEQFIGPSPPPNNGMHPTPLQRASHES